MSIVVVGSLNMDLVARVHEHPRPGETLLGSEYQTHPGGKGANQAVAAARMGARVRMIGRVGRDGFGGALLRGLEAEHVDAREVLEVGAPTGVAFIAINHRGENTIIVSLGANARLCPEDLTSLQFANAKVVLLQLEIPLETVEKAAQLGKEAGAVVVLNAAPARELPKTLLSKLGVLVVNESETFMLTGRLPDSPDSALGAARELSSVVPSVVVTLGSQGACWAEGAGSGHQPGFPVQVVDTTAAGDAFVGALAVALSEELDLPSAVRLGAAAGALAVTKTGAQPSLPNREEVEALLRQAG